MSCVCAVVAGEAKLSRVRKGLDLVKLRVVDETGALELTYFNQSYLKTPFTPATPTSSSAVPRVRRAARR